MITQFESFLDIEMLSKAQSITSNYKGPYLRTNQSWHKDLIKQSTPVLIASVDDQDIINEIDLQVKNKIGNFETTPVFMFWTPGSYIPWHDDGLHHGAVTIYLSSHHEDDGGYFMYKQDNKIFAIKPEINNAVLQEGNTPHCVTTINTGSKIRRTIQVWLKNV